MSQSKLTPLQSETVKIITKFYKRHGYPCSQVYIQQYYGLKSRGTINKRVIRLEKLGYIRRTPDGGVYPHIAK